MIVIHKENGRVIRATRQAPYSPVPDDEITIVDHDTVGLDSRTLSYLSIGDRRARVSLYTLPLEREYVDVDNALPSEAVAHELEAAASLLGKDGNEDVPRGPDDV